jgi:glycosyltransferase involved in cell wall biosynthesis
MNIAFGDRFQFEEKEMDVLILAQYFPPDMGGGATRASNAARGLVKAGCKVTVLAAHPHYPKGDVPRKFNWKPMVVENIDNIRVIRTFVPPLESKGLLRRIFLFLSFMISSLFAIPLVGSVDVLWAANPNILSMLPASFYKKIKGCILAQNVDDLWPEALHDLGVNEKSLMTRIGGFLASIAYTNADCITPISPGYVGVLTKKYRVASDKIQVVRAGVNMRRFRKEKSGPIESRFRVLYIGAFSPAYDFELVFNCAAHLIGYSDIEIVIQGGGELAGYLQRKVNEMNLSNISVINKIVSRDEVSNLMSRASALLLPLSGKESIELGISSKLYEYQASGKPILCCSNGVHGKYIALTKSGIVVKPGDSQNLAKSIIELANNPALAQSMGENGYRYVANNLTIGKIGKRMKNFFRTIISQRCVKKGEM